MARPAKKKRGARAVTRQRLARRQLRRSGATEQGQIREFPKCQEVTRTVPGTNTCMRIVCTSLDEGAKLDVKFTKDGAETTETLTKAGTHTKCTPADKFTIHAKDGDATGTWIVCRCPEGS